jgi:hypothetical protein
LFVLGSAVLAIGTEGVSINAEGALLLTASEAVVVGSGLSALGLSVAGMDLAQTSGINVSLPIPNVARDGRPARSARSSARGVSGPSRMLTG